MTETVAEKPEIKREVSLQPARCNLAEQKRQDWVVDAEDGTTPEDIMKPVYWAHLAQHFYPYDHIEVRLETGAWIADLIVTQVGRNWAQVHLAQFHDLGGVTKLAKDVGATHKVVFKGPHKKHCILRISDSALIKEGIPTAREAEAELESYMKTIST